MKLSCGRIYNETKNLGLKRTGLIEPAANRLEISGFLFSPFLYIVNWVAVRGGYHDWAIYHSMDANLEPANYFDGDAHLKATDEQIARGGAKLTNENKIKEFVPCDEEAFKMYRY